MERQLDAFRQRYPMDDRAFSYLMESPREAQQAVLDSFQPRNPSDVDYSAPVVAYAKRCRARAEENHVGGGGYGGCPAAPMPPPADPVHDFCRQYPVDARAQEYLRASGPEVVNRVLQEFRPKREGESDYSGAVVAFVGRCRKGAPPYQPAFVSNDYGEPPGKRPRYGGPGF